MGEHLSALQLNMLNKKESEAGSQEHIEVSPSDNQMVQLDADIHQHLHMHQRNRIRQNLKIRGDEVDEQTIAVFATLGLQNNSTQEDSSTNNSDDSSSIFASGGAISQALAESDPNLKEAEDAPKPKQPTEAEIKK